MSASSSSMILQTIFQNPTGHAWRVSVLSRLVKPHLLFELKWCLQKSLEDEKNKYQIKGSKKGKKNSSRSKSNSTQKNSEISLSDAPGSLTYSSRKLSLSSSLSDSLSGLYSIFGIKKRASLDARAAAAARCEIRAFAAANDVEMSKPGAILTESEILNRHNSAGAIDKVRFLLHI